MVDLSGPGQTDGEPLVTTNVLLLSAIEEKPQNIGDDLIGENWLSGDGMEVGASGGAPCRLGKGTGKSEGLF